MFVRAIESVAKFTRPIHSISRFYNSTTIIPGTATLFFINAEGWALTCGHVADQLLAGAALLRKENAFRKELQAQRGDKKEKVLLKELERKYRYSKKEPFELHNRFMDCIKGKLSLNIKKHDKLDAALLHFTGYDKLLCDSFPIFPMETSGLQPGMYLCRLGYPFPEFTNYEYDSKSDRLVWTDSGRKNTPRFPIEGMLTRHVIDNEDNIIGFELSTPGLRGQSGGPVFDKEGKVWGMQCQTTHLDLDFDIDMEVLRKGARKRVTDSAFLHVGKCIHVDILKSFMRDNGVAFDCA